MDKILKLKINKDISNIIQSYLLPQQSTLVNCLNSIIIRTASIHNFLENYNNGNYKIKRLTVLYNYKYWCIREKTDLNI